MTKSPPLSPTIYRSYDTLYLDFGSMALAFPFTEGGLGKALAHIPNISGPRGGHLTGRSNFPKVVSLKGHIARVTRFRGRRPILDLPDGMREAALAVVKRRGMGKP
jgi:hypothetical protein